MGLDGHPEAARLGISTVDQNPLEQGRRAVRLALGALDGAAHPHRIMHHLALRPRASTAPP